MRCIINIHTESSTAFYVRRVPNITWAGPSTSAQQKKALSHRDKEIIRCVVQQDAKHPAPRVPSRGWRFFARKKSLPPSNKFFMALGFSSFSPVVFCINNSKMTPAVIIALNNWIFNHDNVTKSSHTKDTMKIKLMGPMRKGQSNS